MTKICKVLVLFAIYIFAISNTYASDSEKYKISNITTVDGGRVYKIKIEDVTLQYSEAEYNAYFKNNIYDEKGEKFIRVSSLNSGLLNSFKTRLDNISKAVDEYMENATYIDTSKKENKLEYTKELQISTTQKQGTKIYSYGQVSFYQNRMYLLYTANIKIYEQFKKFEKVELDIEAMTKYTGKGNYLTSKISDDSLNSIKNKISYFITLYEGVISDFNIQLENVQKFTPIKGKSNNSTTNIENNTDTSNVDPICNDGWWTCAANFMNSGKQNQMSIGTLDALKSLQDLVFDIGNIIFIIVTAFLGVKYIWGGVDSKFSVKTSLITLVVAASVFYGWNAITEILDIQTLLTEESGSGYENFVMQIYNTTMYIVNMAAIGGIIYIGIKYMMAGADGKAEMKLKFIPVAMGIIMVYGTLNLINFIVGIVTEL